MNILLKNARLVQDGRIALCDILLRGKQVEGIFPCGERDEKGSIDLHGQYVSAGFIDMHVHGGGGDDFMGGTVNAFRGVGALHLKHGTTAMLPTTLATAQDELLRCFAAYQACGDFPDSAKLIGLHLEGPYVSPKQCGALNPSHVRNPNPVEYLLLIDACSEIKRWTLAPELDGAMEMAEALARPWDHRQHRAQRSGCLTGKASGSAWVLFGYTSVLRHVELGPSVWRW